VESLEASRMRSREDKTLLPKEVGQKGRLAEAYKSLLPFRADVSFSSPVR
jgi:hypothetical protein